MPGKGIDAVTGWRRFALLLLAALVARAVTFGNPVIHVDEQFYFLMAMRMAHGALPYVDVWDRKSLGLFALYWPAALFGPRWGIIGYQLIATLAVSATAWLIAALAMRGGWRRGSLIAALLYIVWIDFVDGQGGQAPVFYNALIAAAMLVAGPRDDDPMPWRRGMAAMLLVGLALQIKYSCVFEGAWLGLWLLWRARQGGADTTRIAGFAVALMAAAAIPTLAAMMLYAALGHLDAFVFANFTSILARGSDPRFEMLGNLAQLLLCLAPLLIMAGLGRRVQSSDTVEHDWSILLRGWLIAAMLGLLAFGSWFNHYALPVIAPAACCAAAWIGSGRWPQRIGIALLIVAALASEALLLSMPAKRGSPAQFAAIVTAIGQSRPGCLYVYGNDPMLYAATGRCTVSRYLFPSHLTLKREAGSIGVDQAAEVSRIFDRRPAVVVMPKPFPDYGERADIRALAVAWVQHDYRLVGVWPMGRDAISVYELR